MSVPGEPTPGPDLGRGSGDGPKKEADAKRGGGHEDLGEEDEEEEEGALPPSTQKFLRSSGLVFLAIVAFTAGLYFYSEHRVAEKAEQKELSNSERAVDEQRARDRRELEQYAQVDAKAGIYRVALSRALDLVLANPRWIEPVHRPSPPPSAPGAPLAPREAAPVPKR